MILRYRGHYYNLTAASLSASDENIEGKFLGHPSTLPLPQTRTIEPSEAQLMYRGVPLAL